ncbi:MAG: terminase family protein [Firmicutes bacterium]|nr:terminase family protein [Bacillota bacterium]
MLASEREVIKKVKSLEKSIKRYRGKNKLLYYKPHLKQEAFHKCQKRNRWVFGGNRSGKTECGAVEAVMLARGNHPYRENRENVSGWVVSLSLQVQRDVAQSKILDYINPDWIVDIAMLQGKASNPKGGIIDFITIKNVFGGVSRIGFKSCEAGREKFQGTSLDFVWFDEEPPKDIYEECRMRVLDKKGEIFGTMTPLLGLTFIYNQIYLNEADDGEIWHTSMEWADNPHLCKNEVTKVSNTLSESELATRRYGKFSTAKGLVYYEFDESINVIEPFIIPHDWYDIMSIDPGLNNPLSCHWYAVSPDGVVYVIAEHYKAGKDVDWHSERIKSICKGLSWHIGIGGRYEALIDSSAGAKTLSSNKSVVELFFDKGIAVNPRVNKDIFIGIASVKSYLSGDGFGTKLYIFNTCTELIKEIKGYFWASGDTPVKKDDHALDELRYYIMNGPKNRSVSIVKSDIALDKERLLAKRRARSKMRNFEFI